MDEFIDRLIPSSHLVKLSKRERQWNVSTSIFRKQGTLITEMDVAEDRSPSPSHGLVATPSQSSQPAAVRNAGGVNTSSSTAGTPAVTVRQRHRSMTLAAAAAPAPAVTHTLDVWKRGLRSTEPPGGTKATNPRGRLIHSTAPIDNWRTPGVDDKRQSAGDDVVAVRSLQLLSGGRGRPNGSSDLGAGRSQPRSSSVPRSVGADSRGSVSSIGGVPSSVCSSTAPSETAGSVSEESTAVQGTASALPATGTGTTATSTAAAVAGGIAFRVPGQETEAPGSVNPSPQTTPGSDAGDSAQDVEREQNPNQ
jgi:hypothetical protein